MADLLVKEITKQISNFVISDTKYGEFKCDTVFTNELIIGNYLRFSNLIDVLAFRVTTWTGETYGGVISDLSQKDHVKITFRNNDTYKVFIIPCDEIKLLVLTMIASNDEFYQKMSSFIFKTEQSKYHLINYSICSFVHIWMRNEIIENKNINVIKLSDKIDNPKFHIELNNKIYTNIYEYIREHYKTKMDDIIRMRRVKSARK